ncbi:helix-turn-helix domain-containing protein [Rhodococcoides fascians]|uniref:helix-turn-helix domain-containing protein n=1 Tax=Rhodococcoides fascians TaxID=1828 RepID=UPI000562E4EC|nr:GAF domain-containing protein [Rhodococcus fascians]
MVTAHNDAGGLVRPESLVRLLRSISEQHSESVFGTRLRQVETGLNPGLAAEVREAAHAVRSALKTERRRAFRMRDVHEATGDLVAMHSVDAVLREITARARRILDCDYAYLNTPIDDDRGSYAIRAWSGDLDPEFLGIAVEPGFGVGGTVLLTGESFQVSDYGTTRQITKPPGHTELLARQGISTLLATPLMVSGRIIGLLFAARRQSAAFSDDEVFLLTALAQHAAVALQNAELDERRENALRELSAAIAHSEYRRGEQERQSRLQARLSSIVLDGAGIAEVIEAVRVEAGIDTAYLDRSREPAIFVAGTLADLPEPTQITRPRADPPRPAVRPVSTKGKRWAVIDVVVYRRLLGHLVAGPRALEDESVAKLLEWTSQAVALCQLSTQALADAERRSATEVVRRLLFSPITNTLRRQVARSGIGTDGLQILLFDVRDDSAERHITELATSSGGLAAVLEDAAVVLSPSRNDKALTLAHDICSLLHCNFIVGRPITDLTMIRSEYSAALRAMRLADALGYSAEALRVEQFGVFSLLFTDPKSDELEAFIQVQVGPLIEADARHHTDLVATARTILDHGRGLTAAANRLDIHPNTVAQRTDRITRLLGPGWREQPRAFEIHAALKLEQLRDDAR